MTALPVQLAGPSPVHGSAGPTGTATFDEDGLAERFVAAATGTLELFSVHLGRELGLYPLLAQRPLTYPELAAHAGIAPRYAREWLEQQAVAGLVEALPAAGVGSPRSNAETRRYALPAAHHGVLVEPEAATHVAPLADMVAGIGGVLHLLAEAYRGGTGVPYARYGAAFRRGQGGVNRPLFVHDLPQWLAGVPDVDARLRTAPLARVADVGCGEGWSTVALAQAYPQASVDGYDSDPASVEAARDHVAEAGVADRVAIHLVDAAAEGVLRGPYDLVLVFEALHDVAQPLPLLTRLRHALAPDGAVLVADERVGSAFAAPGDPVERLMYGWSVTHCLPASLADTASAGLGTVLRADTVHALARRAGFSVVEELPVENDFFRFYRLDR